MKVLVSGATGFVGNHVIAYLLSTGAEVIATGTSMTKAKESDWFSKVSFVEYRFDTSETKNLFDHFGKPDAFIHLAWEGLPNYKQLHHYDHLQVQYSFLKNLVHHGLMSLTVAGTCFEYGMQSGVLSENLSAKPANPYAIAKDNLRKMLESLQQELKFSFKWVRLFYMYGKGQSKNSIIPLLEKAISEGAEQFNMSGGEQLRDYLSIEKVAENIVRIATQSSVEGIINCCSGKPVSVRKFVEDYLAERNLSIRLNLGFYPYPDYEPMAFWGDNSKLKKIYVHE